MRRISHSKAKECLIVISRGNDIAVCTEKYILKLPFWFQAKRYLSTEQLGKCISQAH